MAIGDVAQSPGDIMRRLHQLERKVQELTAGRRLEAASVGRGGLRIQGGRLLAQDAGGDRVFEVTTVPPTIFMRQELITDLSVAVMANRFHSQSVLGSVNDPGGTFVSADGPTLVDVEVSSAGRCLLLITARIQCQINQPDGVSAQGFMSFQVSGASDVEPNDDLALNHFIFGPADTVHSSTIQATRLVLIDSLNPGLHTISAQYQSFHTDSPADAPVIFSSRNLTAMAF